MIRYHEAVRPLLTDATLIRPDPSNPNSGDVEAIMESIRVNGVYRPVYASSATGQIVAGHNLYAALLGMGAEAVPVLWLDGDAVTARRILLGDNQIARLARMDEALLLDALRELAGTDIGFAATGYTDDDVSRLAGLDTPFRLGPSRPDPTVHTCPACEHTWLGPCQPPEES